MFVPAPNAIVGGKYRLDRPLAQGGMGSVWVAWQMGLERAVAIKFMARELFSSAVARTRFDREAKAAAQLRTPHVVQMHDHGIEGDTPFLVMELLEGEDLNTRVRREKRLPLASAARIAWQVAKALRRAQEAGVVHRDLKPANVFLARTDDEEIVKVLDFGIARVAEQSGAAQSGEPTQSGAVVGSPHYMSPEQARGLTPIDHRADVWSLGVILFRLTTGALPFPGSELGDIIIRVWNDPHPTPTLLAPDLPPSLDAFFLRALAKSPDDRFQTAPELAAAFAEAVGATVSPAEAPFDGSTSSPSRGVSAPSLAVSGTPASFPSMPVAATGAPTPASFPVAGIPPRSGDAGTLGGSHELGPRPASRVPMAVWVMASIGLLALGAGVLIVALRMPSPAPAAASASVETAGTARAAETASPAPTASASTQPTPPAQAAPPASAEPTSAPAATAEASPSASAKRPKGTGRKGHDFGY